MANDRTIEVRPPAWLPIFVAVIVVSGYVVGKGIETRPLRSTAISVTGEGKVYASADIAQVNFGVQTGRQATADGAVKVLSTNMNAIIAAVKEKGIEERDIQTQQLSLYPAFDWIEGEQIARGFEANQQLMVKVRDPGIIGEILTIATSAGANQIGGVNFTIDDPKILQDQARQEAIQDAKERAELLSMQLGKKLGRLRDFAEGGSPSILYRKDMMMEAGGGYGGGGDMGLPVPSGEQEIRAMVTLTYELR